jgi:hypothetical protein
MNDIATKFRNSIDALETEMKKHPAVDITEKHHFSDGIYAREIFIPAGTMLTGKIHKTDHLNIVSQGKITVATEAGNKTVAAPYSFVAKAGTKRAGYAHTDTVWTTIHATQETDLDLIEREVITPDFGGLIEGDS